MGGGSAKKEQARTEEAIIDEKFAAANALALERFERQRDAVRASIEAQGARNIDGKSKKVGGTSASPSDLKPPAIIKRSTRGGFQGRVEDAISLGDVDRARGERLIADLDRAGGNLPSRRTSRELSDVLGL